MRNAFRSIAPVMLAATLSLPVSAYAAMVHPTPVRAERSAIAGLYTLTLMAAKSNAQQRVDLILEQGDAGFTALLLSESNAVALSHERFDGETLRATASTSAASADLVLNVSGDSLTGTLTLAHCTIKVYGSRAQ